MKNDLFFRPVCRRSQHDGFLEVISSFLCCSLRLCLYLDSDWGVHSSCRVWLYCSMLGKELKSSHLLPLFPTISVWKHFEHENWRASWKARPHCRVYRTRVFSRASKEACLLGVFSATLCFMQAVTHIEQHIIQRLNKCSKFLGNINSSFMLVCK